MKWGTVYIVQFSSDDTDTYDPILIASPGITSNESIKAEQYKPAQHWFSNL